MSENILNLENKMFSIIELETAKKGVSIIRTPTGFSRIDGILVKDGVLLSVMECKSKMTLDFTNPSIRQKGWLIDYKKVEAMALVAKTLCVPAYLYGYIAVSQKIFVWQVANAKGEIKNCSAPEDMLMSESSITRQKSIQQVCYLQFSKACMQILEPKIQL